MQLQFSHLAHSSGYSCLSSISVVGGKGAHSDSLRQHQYIYRLMHAVTGIITAMEACSAVHTTNGIEGNTDASPVLLRFSSGHQGLNNKIGAGDGQKEADEKCGPVPHIQSRCKTTSAHL